jgi:predicted flap endonuclease-1-like 5' DNA nuclease
MLTLITSNLLVFLLALVIGFVTAWWVWGRAPSVDADWDNDDQNAGISGGLGKIGAGITGAVGGVAAAGAAGLGKVGDLASDAVNATVDGAKAVGNAAADVAGGAVDMAKDAGGAVVDGAKTVGGAAVDGAKAVGGAVADTAGAAVDGAKAAGGAVVDGVSTAGSAALGGAAAIGGAVVGAASTGKDKAVGLMGDVGSAIPKPKIKAAVGAPDDLELLKGVGPKLNALLVSLGVTRFDQIADWGADDIAEVDGHLGNFKGRVERDNWIDQAKLLAAGDTAGFEAKYGALGSEIDKG